MTHSLTEWADKRIEEKDSVINSLNTDIKEMAKKDASIINSLETKLKELKESKETAKKDASIIPSLKINSRRARRWP